MTVDEAQKAIVHECLEPGGFAFAIRENRVDEQGFSRLIEAIGVISQRVVSEKDQIARIIVACLFELPWEVENTVDHYSGQSPPLGTVVRQMAERLRESIHELLWTGLESYYKGPINE